MKMKELTQKQIGFVSGGVKPGDNQRKGTSTPGPKSGGIYSSVDSCGAGIFGGMVAGMPGGPVGMAAGIVGGAIAGQCTKDSFSNKSGGQKPDNSSGQSRR